MRLSRIAASIILTMTLASIGHAQTGYYGPSQPYPPQGGYGWTPNNQQMPTPPAAGPYAWPPTPAYQPMTRNQGRPDFAVASRPQMPLPPGPAPQPPQVPSEGASSGLMDQMLSEASLEEQAIVEPMAEPIAEPAVEYEPITDGYHQTSCEACGQCLPGCRSPWYMSIAALVMGRNHPNKLWTSYESSAPANFLMNTHDTGFGWHGGNEIRFGRLLAGGPWALEAQYWTLYPIDSRTTVSHASGVSSPLDVSQVNFNATSGSEWFDNSLRHRLRRTNEIHNVELNLVRFASMHAHPDDRLTADWSLGLRYFRFQERLTFSAEADPTRAVFVADPTLDTTAVLSDRVTNSLVGFQVGCNVDYRLFSQWRLFAKPQIGIYGNHIEHEFFANLDDGTGGVPDVASGQTGTYPVRSTVDVFSVLTQLDVGLEWQVGENWSVEGGYRMMVATGIGLADHQIPNSVVNINELADIDRNGELILHGAFLNVIYDH